MHLFQFNLNVISRLFEREEGTIRNKSIYKGEKTKIVNFQKIGSNDMTLGIHYTYIGIGIHYTTYILLVYWQILLVSCTTGRLTD